jgi:hypothetical protein
VPRTVSDVCPSIICGQMALMLGAGGDLSRPAIEAALLYTAGSASLIALSPELLAAHKPSLGGSKSIGLDG